LGDSGARAPGSPNFRVSSGELARAGFSIETKLAGLPTAFVAGYGSGRPVIGIVALMDALSGLSQEKFATERRPGAHPTTGHAGHGCGHHLIGAGWVTPRGGFLVAC